MIKMHLHYSNKQHLHLTVLPDEKYTQVQTKKETKTSVVERRNDRAGFWTTAVGKLWRDALYDDTIGRNGMII